MSNTLTWDIKPIQLPKINSNLLSVVSLILLFTMAFLTVAAIASHCEEIKKNLGAAIAAEGVLVLLLISTQQVLKAALVSGNPWCIGLAVAAVVVVYAAIAAVGALIIDFTVKLVECENEHGSENSEQ